MLLLARAANDAAEPWGFSNFCIVAHPCAGHKKSQKNSSTHSMLLWVPAKKWRLSKRIAFRLQSRNTNQAPGPFQYGLRDRRKIHRSRAIEGMRGRRGETIGKFLEPYASVLVDELPIGGFGRSAR